MSSTAVPKTRTLTDVVIKSNNTIHKLLSIEEVIEVTKRALSNNDVTVVEYVLRPYSDKLGFLGSHYRLDVTVLTKKRETIALSLFLKAIPYELPGQADYVIDKGVFERETKFYGVIMPLLCERYRGKPWTPMCYKVTENLLVFEELGFKSYSTRDKLFDETLVRAGLSAIARLHAASILAETHLGIPFNQLHPDIFTEKGFTHDGTTRKWIETGFDMTAAVAERHGHDPNLVRATCERLYDITEPSRTKTNVVSHGDLWGNNLMFNNDVPPNCLLVDFQMLRYVPLAHDVAQFLYLCTDRSFREARESAMLQYYYETLCEILNVHEAPRIPAWSEVVEGMEEQRLGAVISATLLYPVVLIDQNVSMEITKDSTSFNKFYFTNRNEFIFSIMKNDPVYERRINEAVLELAELASQIDQLPKPS